MIRLRRCIHLFHTARPILARQGSPPIPLDKPESPAGLLSTFNFQLSTFSLSRIPLHPNHLKLSLTNSTNML